MFLHLKTIHLRIKTSVLIHLFLIKDSKSKASSRCQTSGLVLEDVVREKEI